MLKVELIKHTENPEQVVAASARLCYSPVGVSDLMEQIHPEKAKELVEKVVSMGHLSTLEHVNFTFGVEGISRTLTHQLVRHRIASYSQQSQRYVKEESFEYIMPPKILKNQEADNIYKQTMEQIQEAYNRLLALGIDREDARYVLPNASETKIVITMNARSLLHFFDLRCCRRAQWEIRQMAGEMLELAKEAAPVLFAKAGAPCRRGPCPEGDFTCGKPQK